jgi:hypothetical protein
VSGQAYSLTKNLSNAAAEEEEGRASPPPWSFFAHQRSLAATHSPACARTRACTGFKYSCGMCSRNPEYKGKRRGGGVAPRVCERHTPPTA